MHNKYREEHNKFNIKDYYELIKDSNYEMNYKKKFTNREILDLNSLTSFYNKLDDNKVNKMIEIINKNKNISKDNKISLRLLDYFITKYSSYHNITLNNSRNDSNPLHVNYKAQLKMYRKKYFDPFRRREKIIFKIKNIEFETTIGQLNFFKWAFQYNILDYVDKYKSKIEKSMKNCNKKMKRRKQQNNDIVTESDNDNISDNQSSYSHGNIYENDYYSNGSISVNIE